MWKVLAASSLAFFAACVDQDPVPQGSDSTPTAAGLHDVNITNSAANGSFGASDGEVRFGVEIIGTAVYDMWVELHDMRLTLLVDAEAGVMEWDGYAAATGALTQMTEEDRATLLELYAALDVYGSEHQHLSLLRKKVGNWAETSDAMNLQWQKLFDRARGYTSLCGSCGSWRGASHDCDHGGWNTDVTSTNGLIRYEGSLCSVEGTKYGTSSSNVACLGAEPAGYTTYEYIRGNCLGRCGPGCASNDTQFTQDCLNHDSCVRGGHALASAYCDDQLASCTDDDVSAPHCGTGC